MRPEVSAYFIDGPYNGQRRTVATTYGKPPGEYFVAFVDPAEGASEEPTYVRYSYFKPHIGFLNAVRVHCFYLLDRPT